MGDGDCNVVRIGRYKLGGGGAVTEEEIKKARGDDGTLGDAGMDGLEGGCGGQVEAGCLPTA